MDIIKQIAKAIAGGITGAGTALVTAASEGGVSTAEWWGILGAALVGFGAVWAIPNAAAD